MNYRAIPEDIAFLPLAGLLHVHVQKENSGDDTGVSVYKEKFGSDFQGTNSESI